MSDCRITHIRKPDRLSRHEHITHVGNPPTWFWARENVIYNIEKKLDTFYVINPETRDRSDVGIVYPTDGRKPYLRTYADGKWDDNLLSLPEY